ncbi:hypothetical protein BRADI_1g39141v3 [Brachypodium distachyon]|uniref:Uncharacterized protein n=1 Tax=Brachypodium distachyon TaxID=15368 RepID=A0A0Q3NL52_BRADI|nr:hypothetical protein BRADI_1g39141v3 [Brachypodium distachyon]
MARHSTYPMWQGSATLDLTHGPACQTWCQTTSRACFWVTAMGKRRLTHYIRVLACWTDTIFFCYYDGLLWKVLSSGMSILSFLFCTS